MPDARLTIVDLLIRLGFDETMEIVDRMRAEIVRRVGSIRGSSISEMERTIRAIITEYEPRLADILADVMLSSWVAAMDDVAGRIDPAKFSRRTEPAVSGRELLFRDRESVIRLPMIERAAENLHTRQVLRRADFDRLSDRQREFAFTLSGEDNLETIDKVRGVLAELVEEGPSLQRFKDRLDEAFDGDSPLSESRREIVYRANVQTAYKRGTDEVMADPIVAAEFPYVMDASISDGRRTDTCSWFSTAGIGGSNIYRSDDRTYQRFSPPRHFGCRTGRVFLTLEDAARMGVGEASAILQSGRRPSVPYRTPKPPPEVLAEMWFQGGGR